MARHRVQVAPDVAQLLQALDDKGRRICANNLRKLATGPYPGRGPGDKERLVVRGEEVFRLRIRRTYTAFYVVIEAEKIVRVLELLPIDQAHKKYGERSGGPTC